MMNCECQINYMYEPDFGPTFMKATLPKARTFHSCCECNRIINPGEYYTREEGVWDGRFSTYKTCVDCKSLRDVFFCSYFYGQLLEDLADHIGETDGRILSDDITHLTDRARLLLFTMIEEYWEDSDD